MFKTWEDAVLRVGLLASAALCWYSSSRLWEAGNMIVERGAVALAFIGYFLSALLLFMVVIQSIPRWARLLIPLAVILMWSSLMFVNGVNRDQAGHAFTTDVHLFSDYAASLVRHGENPYIHDLLDSYRVYRASALYSTPLIDGDIVGGVSYPSLAFLVYVPFQLLSINTALIYPLMLLATLLLLYGIAPPALRPLAVLPFLVNPNYLLYSLGGVNDIGWALLLCIMIAVWRRAGWRAIVFGLACAFKQQPWFLVPFLLVRLWYENNNQPLRLRLWELAKFGLIAGGVFLVLNAPYIAANFNAWLGGILRPLTENMIVLGQGYSSLSLFGIIFFPDWTFSFFTYGLLAVLIYLYARFYRQWTEALWILPAIVLWFGRRSLSSYWYYYLFPLAAALLIQYRRNLPAPIVEKQTASRLWLTPVIIGAVALIGTIGFAAIPNPIQIALVGPVLYSGINTRLTVQVENHSAQPLTPRFSVESWSEQPAFWDVLNGPSVVEAGEQSLFTLHTDYPLEIFNATAGAQVIVSDASSYGLRASTFLPAAALIYPDHLPNTDYVYWNAANDAPYGWGFVGNSQTGEIRLSNQPSAIDQPQRLLQMELTPSGNQPSELALDTWLMLPEAPITLWIKPPTQANQAPDFETLYGIQAVLTANGKRFYVLFGDADTTGTLPNGDPYRMVAAPADVWSQQTIRIPEIISLLNVPLPDPEIRAVSSLQIPMQMINFRLYVRSAQPLVAEFGTITMADDDLPLHDLLIEDTIQSPADLLLWRGDINLKAGNDALASQYYQQAVDADSTSGAAYFGLASAQIHLGNYADAQTAVQSALDHDYPFTARAYWTLGNAYLSLSQYQEAQTAFTSALDRLTRDLAAYDSTFQAAVYSGLGDALMLQDRPEVAEGMFARASQLNPFDLANYQALFSIYSDQARCAAAAVLVDQSARYALPITAMDSCD